MIGGGPVGGGPARANEASISSWVRFLERRKASFCSMGAEETDGSWRTCYGLSTCRPKRTCRLLDLHVTAPSMRSSRTILNVSYFSPPSVRAIPSSRPK